MTSLLPPLVDYDEIVSRIDKMIELTGVMKKDVARACGMSGSQFSDKRAERGNRFSLEEINRLHGFFQKRLGHPLPMWPLVSYEHSLLMSGVRGIRTERDTD